MYTLVLRTESPAIPSASPLTSPPPAFVKVCWKYWWMNALVSWLLLLLLSFIVLVLWVIVVAVIVVVMLPFSAHSATKSSPTKITSCGCEVSSLSDATILILASCALCHCSLASRGLKSGQVQASSLPCTRTYVRTYVLLYRFVWQDERAKVREKGWERVYTMQTKTVNNDNNIRTVHLRRTKRHLWLMGA